MPPDGIGTAAKKNLVLNCGYGHGYSVREVLAAVEKEVGIHLDVQSAPRRPGDAVTLVADASRLRNDFAWQPRYDDLGVIIRTAVDCERKLAGEGRAKPPND